ncbi:MAG TPA: methylated-DNA--[protein]-cysteine S-methyltransferase [Paenirhodobacter sp.]
MTPLTFGRLNSPLGDLLIAIDAEGRILACEYADIEDRLHRLLNGRALAGGYRLSPGPVPPGVVVALKGYFAGDLAAIDALAVQVAGTEFQTAAWAALRQIPAGQPASYGAQAARMGRPGAARAVGHANHLNPVQIIIPCHRVIATSGALTGYAGGLERKRWLLDHERRHAGPADLFHRPVAG